MEKFTEWWRQYHTQISWWVIGWLSFAVLDSLIKGDYTWAALNAALAYFNYFMWKKNS